MSDSPQTVNGVLDRLDEKANDSERVSIHDLIAAFGRRSFGPLLMVPALIGLSPLAGVPGMPTLIGVIIILFAGQIAFGRSDLWIPGLLGNRSVKAERIEKAAAKLRPLADRMDRWFHGRLPALTTGIGVRVAAGACVLLALVIAPLELLPFAAALPLTGIALIGLALLVHDGALMIGAWIAVLLGAGALAGLI